MPKIMEAEAMAWLNLHSSADGCWPQVVGNEHRGGDWHTAFRFDRRKYEVRLLGVRRLCVPFPQVIGEGRVQGNVAFGLAALGWSVLPPRPAFGNRDPRLVPEHICPA